MIVVIGFMGAGKTTVGQLLADRKERFLATAVGSELLCKVYAPA